MEDQGKRILLAVALAFLLMLGWNWLFPPPDPPPPTQEEDGVAESSGSGDSTATDKDAPERAGEKAEATAVERGEEELVTFEFEQFRAVLSSYGGVVRSWQLVGEQYSDRETGEPAEMIPLGETETERALRVKFAESTADVPAQAEWQVVERSDSDVLFAWEGEGLRVEKRYTFVPEEFRAVLTVRVENRGQKELKQQLVIGWRGYQDPSIDTGGGWSGPPREWRAGCLAGEELLSFNEEELVEEGSQNAEGAKWAGMVHSYFLAAVAPDTDFPGSEGIRCALRRAKGERRGLLEAELVYPVVVLAPGQSSSRELTAYVGPKYLDDLEAISARLAYQPHFEEAVDLGYLAVIARPLLWLLKWFQGFVTNWGIAIILLTLTVKLATLYWTQKSMKSMQAMAKLRPQLEKIREKYEDDKQRQQVETMNLFKTHGVNPLAGCLPMLLQMPIWFALYRGLTVAAELYQAPFIPGWIEDLTAPDPFYIMPVLLTGMMFLQTRLTPQTATGAQQKMIQYGMPLMFGVFSFFFPAGLTVYIFTNTLLTAGHHLYMHRGPGAKAAAKTAAKEPVVDGADTPKSPASPKQERKSSASDDGARLAKESGKRSGGSRKRKRGKKRKGS